MRVKFFSSLVLAIFCWLINDARAEEIFRWVDEQGTIHLADDLQSVPVRYRNTRQRPPLTPARNGILPASTAKTERAQVHPAQAFTIPLIRDGGRLLVDGDINNQSSMRFIVDTGSTMTIIPESVASRLGLDPKRAPAIEVRGVGGVIDGRLIEVDSLKVGHASARNFDVVAIADGLRGFGLLGADFLSRFRMEIDYARDRLVLKPGEGPYGGYPAAWWQEKFRLYHRLKRGYEQRIRQNEEHLRTLGVDRGQRNWEGAYSGKVNPLRPVSDEIKEQEGYLRILRNKMSNLEIRADLAELPRHLRE